MKIELSVKDRYTAAAKKQEPALCCPVNYNSEYLKIIPAEVIEKDYGCGDPSNWMKPGDTVLDLGSGSGKICFIASQIVGAEGKVIGVDMTDAMLEIAERNNPVVAEKIGYSNVEFRKGRIHDLSLDLNLLEPKLQSASVNSANAWLEMEAVSEKLRREQTMIPDGSIDIVVSNCVLNLVEPHLKPQLFKELFRVLGQGGRAVISDIVADGEIPVHLQENDHLWSGCISGAMTGEAFFQAFDNAGFCGIEYVKFETEPWQTIGGIGFRSVTVRAWKHDLNPCLERNQGVIYRGPFKKILDDGDHTMERGKLYTVCEKTYRLYQSEAYRDYFEFLDPVQDIPPNQPKMLETCQESRFYHPREIKGEKHNPTNKGSSRYESDRCC